MNTEDIQESEPRKKRTLSSFQDPVSAFFACRSKNSCPRRYQHLTLCLGALRLWGNLRGKFMGSSFFGYNSRQVYLILMFCGLQSGLFSALNAGPFFSLQENALQIGIPEPEKTFETYSTEQGLESLPPLWHLKITGADNAKRSLEELSLKKTNVIVIDDDLGELADEHLDLPKHKPQTLRLLVPAIVRDIFFREPSSKEQSETAINDSKGKTSLAGIFSKYLNFVEVETLDPREFNRPEIVQHGRHVAGTIGAKNKAYGVSPVAHAIEARYFDAPKYVAGETNSIALKKIYEMNFKDSVINMSVWAMGSFVENHTATLMQMILNQNSNAVIAAGNNSEWISQSSLAGSIPSATVVGAFSSKGSLASFSNYGAAIDLLAPGESILSRAEGVEIEGESVAAWSGTSMATPIVSGAFANLRALLPAATEKQLRYILYRSAWDLFTPGRDPFSGYGLVNIRKATQVAKRLHEGNYLEPLGAAKIEETMKESKLWDFSQDVRAALLEKNKSPRLSTRYESLAYDVVLLSNDRSRFTELAELYQYSYPTYSNALKWIDQNRFIVDEKEEDLDKRVKTFLPLFASSLFENPEALSILTTTQDPDVVLQAIRKISNDELEDLSAVLGHELTKVFVEIFWKSGFISRNAFFYFIPYGKEYVEALQEITMQSLAPKTNQETEETDDSLNDVPSDTEEMAM